MTAIVVPLSKLEPRTILPWHHRISGEKYIGVDECWAKADLVSHVRLARLERIQVGGSAVLPYVDDADLDSIRVALQHACGMS